MKIEKWRAGIDPPFKIIQFYPSNRYFWGESMMHQQWYYNILKQITCTKK